MGKRPKRVAIPPTNAPLFVAISCSVGCPFCRYQLLPAPSWLKSGFYVFLVYTCSSIMYALLFVVCIDIYLYYTYTCSDRRSGRAARPPISFKIPGHWRWRRTRSSTPTATPPTCGVFRACQRRRLQACQRRRCHPACQRRRGAGAPGRRPGGKPARGRTEASCSSGASLERPPPLPEARLEPRSPTP